MNLKTTWLSVSLMTVMTSISFAQTEQDRAQIKSRMDVSNLQQLSQKFEAKEKIEKAAVRAAAIAGNIPMIQKSSDGSYQELQRIDPDGTLIYYTTYNVAAAKSTRANFLHNNGGLGLNVEGQNMTGYIWDGGLARGTHQEYDGPGGNNRFTIGDNSTTLNFHAAHVTGTVIAYGANANAKGMAPQAKAVGHDWNNDTAEVAAQAANGMLLSNHSYGYRGDQLPDYYFGAYITDSRDWDELMFNAPYFLMVKAAGNDGNQNTYNGAPLGGNSAYDKLSGAATAKNNMVVANANDAVINSDGSLGSVTINSSSSEGPTDDLRIKPDITGNGTQVFSTYETSDTAYNSITGTSMASPNVMGSLLLLQQLHNETAGSYMRAATVKGLALHTADDAGMVGPDPIYGWGLMNTKKAAEVITNEGTASQISELTLSAGETYEITVNSDGINDLMASISWTDRAGVATTATNSNTARLVNDLDVRVSKNGSTFLPWRLTGVNTNGLGDNSRDPYERITVANASGTYTIRVTHKGTLTGGSQNYSLIVTGIAAQAQPCVASVPANVQLNGASDKDATIGWTAIPSASYVVRFRESGTTAWTTQQVNNATANLTGLTANTAYQVQVRSVCADGSQSAYSSTINFSTTSVQYCASKGNSVADEYISNFKLNAINKSSTGNAAGYSNFTASSTDLAVGDSYTLEITPTWTGTKYNEAYAMWIDYNQDGDFNDAGEQVFTAAPSQNVLISGSFTVPSGAASGATRLRVSMKYNALPTACETFDYGEVEDYTVNVGSVVADTTAPTAPGSLVANNVSETSATLVWNASSDNVGVTGYEVYNGSNLLTTTTNTSQVVNGLFIGTTYSFSIVAVDAAGNKSNASNVVNVTPVDQTAPSVPANVVVSAITQTTASLNWNASTDNVGVTEYDVYSNGALLGSLAGTTANLTGLTAGTNYSVRVAAKDAAGNISNQSAAVSFTTEPEASAGCVATAGTPYAEGFESGLGGWTQGTGDDFNWTRRSGGTPSNATGPSSASEGSNYVYMESSAPNYSTKTAILNSPCFDLAGVSDATLTFKYHMYGATNMGGLLLQASEDDGASWSTVWSKSGNQGNAWRDASVDLSAYSAGTVRLRFNGTTGTTWQGDMAIDDVKLTDGAAAQPVAANLRITFDNYPEETSWTLVNSSGATVASGGTYASQADGSTVNIPLTLPEDCYTLTFTDAYGDGICCQYGNGSYALTNSSNGAVLASGGSFTRTDVKSFCLGNATNNDYQYAVNKSPIDDAPLFSIYPNPVENGTLNVKVTSLENIKYSVLNMQGQQVLQGETTQAINVSNLAVGVYMLQIETKKETLVERFIIK
ncbi:fibronectin type III domain-containing protein [Nonlabens ponticola]|uniref:T9SS type A sorting domain-containing protein n=1 Tax=Nonlabens ponticola TaxID=2496866 RepID=A0A3S9MXI2_9FLAO|nr:fibronectin type III domain-containing protein [Nonlabens ponticola]AZQ43839.1 T9SS type A sorting domain-containing protein [Nonlabens ponticola]